MTEAIKVLNINGKEYEAKGTFFFVKLADEKYKTADAKGNKTDGVTSIYNKILSYDMIGLLEFWDCATAHLVNAKPSTNELMNTLQEADIDALMKGALEVFEDSGFFKGKIKNFWGQMEMAIHKETDEVKKREMFEGVEMLKEIRDNMRA